MADEVFDLENEPPRKVNRGSVFAALTGRGDSDVSGDPEGSVAGMLRALVGSSPRTGDVDTKAAAEALGVSRRRVQAWLKAEREGRRPGMRAPTREKIVRRSRQAATTKRGRRAALRDVRTRPRRRIVPIKVRISGEQGPRRSGKGYARWRSTDRDLTPMQYEEMLAAYEEGGDDGVAAFLEDLWDSEYSADWGMFTIDAIEIHNA